MAYITADEVATIRADLKEAFPPSKGWKFGVRLDSGHLGVCVDVLAGPDPLRTKESADPLTHADVNHYYIADHYDEATAKTLQQVSDIVHKEHWDKSDAMTDYFNCAFYVHIGIGRWNKPYHLTA